MTTLEIRTTLRCGQEVEITGRYDDYFGVRTDKGEVGYVPVDSLLLLKTGEGPHVPQPPAPEAPHEKTAYEKRATPSNAPDVAAAVAASTVVLTDSTEVHMKLEKALSSSSAQVGDEVKFEVTEDVIVDGLLIIPKGATGTGVVNEAEPKKALGRGGKLSVLINSVQLADNEKARLRSGREGRGASSTAGAIIPVMHGKDITFPAGMEFTAYVNGDTRLKRENFHAAGGSSSAAPAGQATNPAAAPKQN
jgi:hypothetical protein